MGPMGLPRPHSNSTTLSNDRCASSCTRYPAMISSPGSPSTMLSRDSAATTPASPLMTLNLKSVYGEVNIDCRINM